MANTTSTAFFIGNSPKMITTNCVWDGDYPFDYTPLIIQFGLILVVSECVGFLTKHFHPPRFITRVIAVYILGPSIMGRVAKYMNVIYPTMRMDGLEIMGSMGVLYVIFLMEIQVDLEVVKQTGRRAWAIPLPARYFFSSKQRAVRRSQPEPEFRILACVHSTRNVATIINLLEISYPTKTSPIFFHSIHLVELTDRESAMHIVNDTNRRPGDTGGHFQLNRIQAQSEQTIKLAFEGYEQSTGGVSVQPLTVVSAYSRMHEDVCNFARDKFTALIILPFHKQQTVDGEMEATNPGVRTVNQNIPFLLPTM